VLRRSRRVVRSPHRPRIDTIHGLTGPRAAERMAVPPPRVLRCHLVLFPPKVPGSNGHGEYAAPDDETRPARFPLSNFPPIPSPQSSPASGRGGERERHLSIPAGERANESGREFHVNAQSGLNPRHETAPAAGRFHAGATLPHRRFPGCARVVRYRRAAQWRAAHPVYP